LLYLILKEKTVHNWVHYNKVTIWIISKEKVEGKIYACFMRGKEDYEMYEVGDVVIYGKQGVCRIEEIGSISITNNDDTTQYYTLVSVYGTGKTYTPVDTEVYMRPIMTLEEVENIIKEIPNIEGHAIHFKSIREMTDYYKNSIESYEWERLISVIKTVYFKAQHIKQQGKKLGQIDERYKKEAEQLLYQEFAIAMDISIDAVNMYITSIMEEEKNKVGT
jgi:CarD-like/TRCF domain.